MKIYTSAFWERVWRSAGIQSVALFIVGYIVHGTPPEAGASMQSLVSFYDGDRTRILVAAVILGFAVLNLLWFGAALASALRDAGKGGWGAAATAASAAFGAIVLVQITLSAALAYSIAGSGSDQVISGLNDISWALSVLLSFPAAMMLMAGTFGLWRAGMISNAAYWAIFPGWVLVVLGSTTWASSGFWAPDGAYLQYVSPIVFAVLITFFSGLLTRSVAAEPAPEAAPMPTM
jgi:hypothetical protein